MKRLLKAIILILACMGMGGIFAMISSMAYGSEAVSR